MCDSYLMSFLNTQFTITYIYIYRVCTHTSSGILGAPAGREVDVALVRETLGPFQGSFSSKGGAAARLRGCAAAGLRLPESWGYPIPRWAHHGAGIFTYNSLGDFGQGQMSVCIFQHHGELIWVWLVTSEWYELTMVTNQWEYSLVWCCWLESMATSCNLEMGNV